MREGKEEEEEEEAERRVGQVCGIGYGADVVGWA